MVDAMTPPVPAVRPAPRSTAALGGAVAMACVGGSTAVSALVADAPVATAQAVRYGLAALMLVAFTRIAGIAIRRPRGTEWGWLVGVCGCGLVIFNSALVVGSQHAEPAVLGVAVAAVPLVLAVCGPLMHGQRASRRLIGAAVVVTLGSALVQGAGEADIIGILCAATVFVTEVGFTLLAVPLLAAHGPFGVSVHTTWMATVAFGVAGLIADGPQAITRIDPTEWAAIGYLSIAVTAVAFVLWYGCVARLGPARAGLLAGVVPVAAALSGVTLGRGMPSTAVWLGIAVVAVGITLGCTGSRQAGLGGQASRPVSSGRQRFTRAARSARIASRTSRPYSAEAAAGSPSTPLADTARTPSERSRGNSCDSGVDTGSIRR